MVAKEPDPILSTILHDCLDCDGGSGCGTGAFGRAGRRVEIDMAKTFNPVQSYAIERKYREQHRQIENPKTHTTGSRW